MADFLTSTHRDHWILPLKDLAEKRQASNQRAILALKKYGATRVEVQADGSLAYPGAGDNIVAEKLLAEPLTVDEESLLRRFYEQKIQQVCAAFSFPHKIQATAILYFKRFFLNWSVMEHDPKQIMLTCIYISCKVEEFHVSAEEFGKGIQQDPQAVLKNELCLLQELKESTIVSVDNLMLTDAILLWPPGQLALTALKAANEHIKVIDFDRYVKSIADRKGRAHSELTSGINKILEIVYMLKDTRLVNSEDVRPIDRKLKYCRNPNLHDEDKKRGRKIKHKPKQTLHDAARDSA